MPPSNSDQLADQLNLVNAGYVADLYDRYRSDPASVDDEWRDQFDGGFGGFEPVTTAGTDGNGSGAVADTSSPDTGTPPRQAATAEDLASSPAPASTAAAASVPAGASPIKGPAARLAKNMTASLAIPTATSFRELDVSVLEERRRELNGQVSPRKVSFTHLIGYAIVRAAAEHPTMTHAYHEADGTAYRVDPGGVNLGLAVDVERTDGSRFLVVPVIKGADAMDFAAFVARYEELVGRARASKLGPDDMAGATITLTNPGTLGTAASVPRLMPNQGCIVATGTIRGIGQQRLMTVSSTYDHRIIQGAESGAFLRTIDASLRGEDAFYADIFGALHATIAPEVPAPPTASARAGLSTGHAGYEDLKAVAAGMALVKAYRHFGHMAAHLDPLGAPPPGDPALDPAPLGLDSGNMARVPVELMRIYVPGATLAEALPHLAATYCGTIAYEVEHIHSHEERVWLRHIIESGEHRPQLDADARRNLLARLTRVEGLEHFLHKAYLGQKRFSVEGLDAMVPMLDRIIGDAAEDGARDVVIGMAHRGRLSVLSHIIGVSTEAILSEFEAGRAADPRAPKGGLDDVKYHLGADGEVTTAAGHTVRVSLAPNPSHLEAVNPVVEGRTRAQQTDRSAAIAVQDPSTVLPLLLHGDAAFAAQGVVAETFNLARLAGYATGGTIHLITNNQVGFTTEPREGRSTNYSSDLAKGFDAPIIHVNADDPEACLAAARLATMYRDRFRNDVVIDLVGYRRYGHNEGDEPAYTQPTMSAAIASHPSVRELYRDELVAAGLVTVEETDADAKAVAKELAAAQASLRKREPSAELDRGAESLAREAATEPDTAVPAERLATLNEQLLRWPDELHVNAKLAKQLERRRAALEGDEPRIEWGHAESLAFASLLTDGTAIRLTGQDTVRGTFAQRHQALYDTQSGEPYVPMQHLDGATASFEIHNSPLSEYACLGFEYGYAVTAPEALVLWEAQYGDFVNGAEIIIDQFLIAGLAKWRQTSRLTLLLPHGYEGSGPEHSSARLERFLALGAEGNIRVVNPTTPAQYFHLLRRQAMHTELRPLVVMTPKSLLRLPQAASRPSELAEGSFQPVLDDPRFVGEDRAARGVKRVILCSGKIYYDLVLADEREAADDLAIVRVERVYPFATEELKPILARYPKLEKLSWVQEEPRNMGARKFVLPRIRHLVPYKIPLGDVSRPERSRPAEGYPATHAAEQARIVHEALTG